jgi:hypothetical protein
MNRGSQSRRRAVMRLSAMMTSAIPQIVGIPGITGRQHGSAKTSVAKPNAR